MGDKGEQEGPFAVLESVRCLACSTVYAKPTRGGTFRANPGCPECGYVGWLPLAEAITPSSEPDERRRSDGGPRLDRSVRSR